MEGSPLVAGIRSSPPFDEMWFIGQDAVNPAAPLPVVIEGSAEAWSRVQDSTWRSAPEAVAAMGAAAIAGVVGAPSHELKRWLECFDLVAFGEAEAVTAQVHEWTHAFVQRPQACTVAVQLLRRPNHDLLAESLAYSLLQSGPEHAGWLASRQVRPITDAGPRVEVHSFGRYREVMLTRPLRHNALDARMREELCDALDALAVGSHGVIGLRGAGPSFCSGGDLDEFGTRLDPVHAHFVRTSRSVARRLQHLGARLVAGVHGSCIGAGVELPTFAARVIAAEDATFALPETGFGLIPGAGGTVSILARIGRHRLNDLMVTGRTIDATTALDWGLVDEVVGGDKLAARVRAVAEALA